MVRAKIDDNQPDIVKALRKIGCTVQSLATIGQGCPDLLVGLAGRNILIEVKDGSKPPSHRKLTDLEKNWHDCWGGTVFVANTTQEAIEIVTNRR